MKNLSCADLLRSPTRAGVYSIEKGEAERAFRAATTAGLNTWQIDISPARDATSLLKLLGHALHFPDWYGQNWDALADCLSDLSWCEADGHVLLLHGSETIRDNDPQAFETLIDILRDVSAIWREGGVAFWALVDIRLDDVPPLSVPA